MHDPNPLSPIHVPASTRKPKPDARRVMRRMLWPMAGATIIGISVHSVPLLILGAVVWTGWIMYYVLLTRVLDPHGDETPYVNQHSEIQAMVMRGDTAGAVQAYRAVIRDEPDNTLACEQLLQLARKELKDPALALFASREAERRHTIPSRKLVFGMITVEICRRELADPKRALVEISRLLATYPAAPNAAALRAEQAEIKGSLFESA